MVGNIVASATNILNAVLGSGTTAIPSTFPVLNTDRRDDARTATANEARTTTALPDGADAPAIQPASEQAVVEAQVSRRAAAITLAYRTSGEADAAREMLSRTRDLPPGAAAEVVIASRATLESIVTSTFARADGVGRIEQIAIDLVSTIEYVGRDSRGEALAGETAALILDALGRGADEYRLSTLALAIPFGGLKLPLAMADELDRRGDRRRKQRLLLAMERGLRRLRERIATSVGALIELTLPLAGLVGPGAEVDGSEPDRARRLLQDHILRDANLLAAFGGALRRVDAIGYDGFVALDALARRRQVAVELHSARAELLASRATAFAIGQSAAAQDAALRDATLRGMETGRQDQHQTSAISVESAERMYLGLGFIKSRSTVLAHATVSWHSAALLDARWAVVDWSGDPDHRGPIFKSLLRFVGAAPIRRRIQAIDLSNIDDELAVRPVWGLPLYRSLEQA